MLILENIMKLLPYINIVAGGWLLCLLPIFLWVDGDTFD